VKILKSSLKTLEASLHYQYWTYLIGSAFNIESIPTTIVELKHLTELRLWGCENLKELAQTIGNISSLSKLNLFHWKSIESLPTTISDLKHLTELRLGGCENLKELPKTIRSMSSLLILY
jgi:Leucine-rich repeat (LRR) protein